jgi:4-hydroxybenzoyl-CoA thioesterase
MTSTGRHTIDPAPPGRFERIWRIRFGHCDPAGIVYYPQILTLFNHLVEDWVEAGLGIPYAPLVTERRVGLPTVRLEVDFRAVSRMGEDVAFALAVERLGGKSITLAIAVHGPAQAGGERPLRVQARKVLVTTDLDTHRAIALPSDLRRAAEAFAALPLSSRVVAGPSQDDLSPTGGGPGAARPWGPSDLPEPA